MDKKDEWIEVYKDCEDEQGCIYADKEDNGYYEPPTVFCTLLDDYCHGGRCPMSFKYKIESEK